MGITHYRIKSLNEVEDIAAMLSQNFPAPHIAELGIYELLLNSIEHGNLEISHEEKTKLIAEEKLEAEISKRENLPQNQNKYVEIVLLYSDEISILTITDQGNGFDWQKYNSVHETSDKTHGRGIMLANNCGFDSITYNKAGNSVVIASKKIQK